MIVTLNRSSQSGLSKNCLGCDRFLECKDPMKSVLYACTRFKETKTSKDDGGLRIMDFLKLDFDIERTDMSMEDSAISKGPLMVAPGEESGFNIQKIITDIVENDKVVSSDIKINDRDFLQAPNFYEFCIKDNYLKQDPFVEQAILGIRVLAEYCPDCTDMEWFDHTHKVDDTLLTFERKVALLDKGVCPHCHKKRSRMVNKGALRHYNEAAICCGQRSGKSAWIGMMAAYLTHLQIKLQKPNEVYGLLKANILHGTFCALTYAQAKDTLWEPYYGHLTDSPWFCLAEGTQVRLASGTTKAIEDICVGDEVKTEEGTSFVAATFDNGSKECFDLELENGFILPGTADHKVRCLSDDGLSLVWKRIGDITENDFVVVDEGADDGE